MTNTNKVSREQLMAGSERLMAEARERLDQPTAAELHAYLDKKLSAEDTELMRERLVAYPDSARLLLAMQGRRAPRLGTLACFLVAAILGCGAPTAATESSEPILGVAPQIVLPSSTRCIERPTPLAASDAPFHLLILAGDDGDEEYASYRLEIDKQEQGPGTEPRVIWTGDGIRRVSIDEYYTAFVALIPRAFLPAGRYRLKVYGVNGGEEPEELDRWWVRTGPAGSEHPCGS